ncbi:NADH-quinone oxidoreductase subunit C [Streptomyces sp. NPDC003710]
MTTIGWLPVPVEDLFGPEATAEESYEVLTVDVPPAGWTASLRVARDELGCTYFDWLSAVDEPGTGLRVSAHVVALSPVRRLLLRTTVPHETAVLPSAVEIYAGAAWHERETHEMFGITFEGHPALDHLLLPEGFEGHPLRKDFVLAARVAKAWPGAKEPGESDHGGPKRRQMLPPGVPDPNEWGPLKGQLPPAPARPARATGRAAGDRPVRRTRTTAEGSASQAPAAAEPAETTPAPAPRRARSVSEGSASQRRAEPGTQPATPAGPRRARSTSEGSASQRAEADTGATAAPAAPAGPRRARSASEGSASQRAAEHAAAPRSADAPWHHARPAFDEQEPTAPEPSAKPQTSAEPSAKPQPPAEPSAAKTEAGTAAETPAEAETAAEPSAEAESPTSEGNLTPATDPDATGGKTRSGDTRSPEDRPGGSGPGKSRPGDTQRPKPPTPDERTPDEPTPDDPSGGTQ